MITRDYDKATASLPCLAGYEDVKLFFIVKTAHGWYYHASTQRKCRACRNLPRRQQWTGARVCACGNPYVNTSGLDRLESARRATAAGLYGTGTPAHYAKVPKRKR